MIKVLLLTHVRRVDKHTTIHVAIVDINHKDTIHNQEIFPLLYSSYRRQL